ncbi:hypothetical protein [Nocardia macrotermitis]|uniref:Uncharacterized protein n=1 Tax=Nocardia macrotermitis TaxID=2585198 RepID=A0A7K0D338_9NOCA|nr:hypothetical protein [Nocardia macrotermitis]MQY20140.1 hypothetical protein [Nocardia macrotermitis]
MSNCTKCHRHLNECQDCRGGRAGQSPLGDALHCRNCKDTGLVCNEHGGHWQ